MPKYNIAYDQDDPEPELIDGPEALARIQAILDIVSPGDRGRVVELLGQFLRNESGEPDDVDASDNSIEGRQEFVRQRNQQPGGGAVPLSQDAALRQRARDSAGFAARWPGIRVQVLG